MGMTGKVRLAGKRRDVSAGLRTKRAPAAVSQLARPGLEIGIQTPARHIGEIERRAALRSEPPARSNTRSSRASCVGSTGTAGA